MPQYLFFVDKEACNFITKKTLAQVISCELCEIFKNIFFYRTLLVTAFVFFLLLYYMKYWKLLPLEEFFFEDFSGTVQELITHNLAEEWPNEPQACLQHSIKHFSRSQWLYLANMQSPIK